MAFSSLTLLSKAIHGLEDPCLFNPVQDDTENGSVIIPQAHLIKAE
jgi:hypothetical protein